MKWRDLMQIRLFTPFWRFRFRWWASHSLKICSKTDHGKESCSLIEVRQMLEDLILTFCKVPDSRNEDVKVDEAQDCKKVTFLWWRHNPRFAQKLEDCTGQLIISKCCALLTILPPSSGTQSDFLNEGYLSAEGVAAYHCLLIEASVMRIVVEVGQSTINMLL